MKIAVVGSGGFIGKHLTEALAGGGHEVQGLVRNTPLPGTRFDVVIDCNGDARRFWANQHPLESYLANVDSVAQRVTRLRYGRYFYLSTIDVYGGARGVREATGEDVAISLQGLDNYGLHKFMAECLVRHHARDHVVLRLGTVVGPGLRKNPLFDALAGNVIRQTVDSTLALVDLATIARAVLAFIEVEVRGVYNVAARAPITLAEILRMMDLRFPGREHSFDSELLQTRYDICVDRIEPLVPMPTPEDLVANFLAHAQPGQSDDRHP